MKESPGAIVKAQMPGLHTRDTVNPPVSLGSEILEFKQQWFKNIRKKFPESSRKFQNANFEFAMHQQLFT